MLDFYVYDVFTDRSFAGNPLAVVTGADGLDGARMQAIAAQFNLSETIFVLPPDDPAHRARVRIFLPRAEIPFAGHPTIGCALHLCPGDGDLVLEEAAGPVPVRIRDGLAEFAAPRLPGPTAPVGPELAAAALGLEAADLGHGAHRPCSAGADPGFVMVPLRDTAALARARPTGTAFEALTRAVPKVYCHAPDGAGTLRARMFAPANGIAEDPATGSAAVALAAPLLEAGALPEGETRLTIRQGIEMGRPSTMGLRIAVRGGALSSVRVSGRAVLTAQGRIAIPEGS